MCRTALDHGSGNRSLASPTCARVPDKSYNLRSDSARVSTFPIIHQEPRLVHITKGPHQLHPFPATTLSCCFGEGAGCTSRDSEPMDLPIRFPRPFLSDL